MKAIAQILRWEIILVLAFSGCFFAEGLSRFYFIETARGGFVFVKAGSVFGNGSPEHPFATINRAVSFINKHSEFNTIFVNSGIYEESVNLPKDAKLIGKGENVWIESANLISGQVIQINGNNWLYNLKIKGGHYGVKILPGAAAVIANCNISRAGKFGIFNEPHPVADDSVKLSVLNSTISGNGDQGLYLQKGSFYINNCLIEKNGEEGIDLHIGAKSVVKNTILRNNSEGGLESEVGENEILVENCLVEGNGASGLNFQSHSRDSKIRVANNTIRKNAEFGIRCALHAKIKSPYFKEMVEIGENEFIENGKDMIDKNCIKR